MYAHMCVYIYIYTYCRHYSSWFNVSVVYLGSMFLMLLCVACERLAHLARPGNASARCTTTLPNKSVFCVVQAL